jgi:hypothetical protein
MAPLAGGKSSSEFYKASLLLRGSLDRELMGEPPSAFGRLPGRSILRPEEVVLDPDTEDKDRENQDQEEFIAKASCTNSRNNLRSFLRSPANRLVGAGRDMELAHRFGSLPA